MKTNTILDVAIVLQVISVIMFLLLISGCTLSFTNISTHGQASNLVDEQMEASPDVDANVSIPAI
jgi:competence protein ComGC